MRERKGTTKLLFALNVKSFSMISFSKKEQGGDVWMDACVVSMQLAIVSFFLFFLFYDYKFTCCCALQTW